LRSHPQLAPSIGRLVGNKLKLFDGQHKLAAQVLNNQPEVDIKIYVSPDEAGKARKLFDGLMITNLEAHSKLKQIPFYTSTLLDRLSVIYNELIQEFIETKPPEYHTEQHFTQFLVSQKGYTSPKAKEILRGAIITSALEPSSLKKYVAEASKDASFPITMDLLNTTIFKSTLYLEPSDSRFTSEKDYRSSEVANFGHICDVLVSETGIENWIPHSKGKSLSNTQLKARRIWHKGSVLTWSPYLESMLYFALQFLTQEEREKRLYRPEITNFQKNVLAHCSRRLFSHPMWDDLNPEIDSLLGSAKRQQAFQQAWFDRRVCYQRMSFFAREWRA
jgi:hypothetical protein